MSVPPFIMAWKARIARRDAVADNRIWLDVAFAEKDEAKAHGARWDPTGRRWYAPRPGITALDRWQALPDVPYLLPGDDRDLGSGLFVDLVPSSCWFSNVRSCVDQRDWERLHPMITSRADNAVRYADEAKTERLAGGSKHTSAGHMTIPTMYRRYVGSSASAPTATPPPTLAWHR
jgi:hypothetical protein